MLGTGFPAGWAESAPHEDAEYQRDAPGGRVVQPLLCSVVRYCVRVTGITLSVPPEWANADLHVDAEYQRDALGGRLFSHCCAAWCALAHVWQEVPCRCPQ